MRAVVIGAGASGLTAAEWLSESALVTVLEAGARAGGKVRSERVGGRVFEWAANGFLDNEPAMGRLLRRLDLRDRLLPATRGARYLFVGGAMRAIPTSPPKFLASPILSLGGKARLLMEPWAKPRPGGDQSIADFVRRRIGHQPLERMVGPMVSGIFAGDPERLSLAACFPKMDEMEREHGSLFRAMRARKKTAADAAAGPSGHLHSLRGGMGVLVEALAGRREDLRLETPATGLERVGEAGWRVHTPGGSIDASAVVLAAPAPACAGLLEGLDDDAAAALSAIPYASIAVVTLALPADGWSPPEGFGCLIPRGEGLRTLGVLFTSSLFPDHSPDGAALLRCMIGGATDPEAAGLPAQKLLDIARREAAIVLGQALPEPLDARVYAHPAGIPQYALGHLERVGRVRAAELHLPGLFVCGNHQQGVGVKDCVRGGEQAARRALAYLSESR